MKIVDKVFFWILSIFMFVLSLVSVFGYLNIFGLGEKIFSIPLNTYKDMTFNTRLVMLIISLILNLITIKGIFFQSKKRKKDTSGILLENNNGKLSISKETIQNLIMDVANDVDGINVIKSESYLNEKGSLSANIDITVYKEVNIKEVSKELQEKVKRVIKNMTDIETEDINIHLKNISNKRLTKKQEINRELKKIDTKEKIQNEDLNQKEKE